MKLGTLADLFSVGGSLIKARAQRQYGKAVDSAAQFEAEQLEQKAGQSIAVSQRVAREEVRKAELAQSRALALAAASGGGASDPTVVNIIAGLAGEGAYRQMVALYEGEDRARSYRLNADARRYEGKSARKAGTIGATGTLLSAGGSMLAKYGGGGFSSDE